MHICETVTIDERGRCTLGKDAQKALCIQGINSTVRATATVVWPLELRGRKAQFQKEIDSQGRFTIPMTARRDELGVEGQGASLSLTVEAVGEQTEPPF